MLNIVKKTPKTVLFFKQIELVFQKKGNSTTKNGLFEKIRKPLHHQTSTMNHKRSKLHFDCFVFVLWTILFRVA